MTDMSWRQTLLASIEARDECEKKDTQFYSPLQEAYDRVVRAEERARRLDITNAQRELHSSLEDNERLRHELTEQQQLVRSLEQKVATLKKQNSEDAAATAKLKKAVATLTAKLNTQADEHAHRNRSIEQLNDEFLATQIQNNLLHDTLERLERENKQLVQRWLAKVQQDADRINAILER